MDSSHNFTFMEILRSYHASFTPRETAPNQKRTIIIAIVLGAILVFGVVAVLAAVALVLTEQEDDEEDAHRVFRSPGRFGSKNIAGGTARSEWRGSNEQDVILQDLTPALE